MQDTLPPTMLAQVSGVLDQLTHVVKRLQSSGPPDLADSEHERLLQAQELSTPPALGIDSPVTVLMPNQDNIPAQDRPYLVSVWTVQHVRFNILDLF